MTKGGLVIPGTAVDARMQSQTAGTLVAVGPDAYVHYVQKHGDGSVTTSGYSTPFAKLGQKVMFAKFGGITAYGKDGLEYRVMRDEDITAVIDEGVTFSDLDARKPISKSKK